MVLGVMPSHHGGSVRHGIMCGRSAKHRLPINEFVQMSAGVYTLLMVRLGRAT